jgi:hypothetical protein
MSLPRPELRDPKCHRLRGQGPSRRCPLVLAGNRTGFAALSDLSCQVGHTAHQGTFLFVMAKLSPGLWWLGVRDAASHLTSGLPQESNEAAPQSCVTAIVLNVTGQLFLSELADFRVK